MGGGGLSGGGAGHHALAVPAAVLVGLKKNDIINLVFSSKSLVFANLAAGGVRLDFLALRVSAVPRREPRPAAAVLPRPQLEEAGQPLGPHLLEAEEEAGQQQQQQRRLRHRRGQCHISTRPTSRLEWCRGRKGKGRRHVFVRSNKTAGHRASSVYLGIGQIRGL